MSSKPLRTLSKDGSPLVTDEFYNTLLSSLGAILSAVGLFFLIFSAIKNHQTGPVIAFSVYGATLLFLFIASALHHGINGSEETEHFLRQLDYYAIFLTIAGTFTPFCLILLKNKLGWRILALMWLLALVGIGLKTFYHHLPKWIWISFYMGMGWLGLVIVKPFYQMMPQGLVLLILGGLFFTIGGIIYFLEKPNPFPGKFGFHEIWHLFVLAGTASHFCLMYFYLLPYSQR